MPGPNDTSPQEMERTRRQIRSGNVRSACNNLSDRAQDAWEQRRQRDEDQAALQGLREANEEFEDLGWGRKFMYVFSGIPAHAIAYGIDMILFSATANHLLNLGFVITVSEATQHLPGPVIETEIVALFGLLTVAALLVGSDVMIANQMIEAGRKPRQLGDLARESDWKAYRRWKKAGYGLAVVVAALVAVVYVKKFQVMGGFGASQFIEATMLTGLALITHGGMIYGGALLYRGRAYTMYRFLRWRLGRRVRQAVDSYDEARRAVIEAFSTYREALQTYNRHHPDEEITLPLFDTRVREIINEIYGQEVIPGAGEGNPDIDPEPPLDVPPPSGDGSPDGPAGPHGPERPPEPPPAGADGDDDAEDDTEEESYLERVLRRRRADADGELRP